MRQTPQDQAPRAGTRPRRHLRWLLPLLGAPVLFVVMLAVVEPISTGAPEDPSLPYALGVLTLIAVTFLAPLALLVTAVVQAARVRREARRRAGRFTRRELAEQERRAQAEASAAATWHQAVGAARAIVHGGRPPALTVWDVVPWHDESFHADVPIGYARYYGTAVQVPQTVAAYAGRPAFVAAGLATTALLDAGARAAALRQAVAQWREHQSVRLVVSDRRLVVQRHGEWLSFDHGGLTAVYPDPDRRGIVCQYRDCAPVMLWGEHAPLVAVVVVAAAYGPQALLQHPAMASIAHGVRASDLPTSPGSRSLET